ncbi:MAG: SWIM zinc finger family protein [Candidatus Competibacteraceae bacterium]|jgi:uncharacterized Zn finger protein|nr:SWIM zinc finger family protein [Candidatus Competibacteraceae bacterium]
MAKLTRTWWGQRFIEALEKFTEPGRLGRGRSYANSRRIHSHSIKDGKVTAKIEGNINPYFGVYKTPMYTTTVQLTPMSQAQWDKIIPHLAGKASMISQLLMNEMPAGIEEALGDLGLHLLPANAKDFKTQCSCPDYSNPCKHIAGLCYFLAAHLDRDPMLLFELRGLSHQNLQQALLKTPLGRILAQALTQQELPLQPVTSYYTRPRSLNVEKKVSYRDFWAGEKRLTPTLEPLPPPGLPAILIKKAGDSPPFWHQQQSFIGVMTEFYERVKKHAKI